MLFRSPISTSQNHYWLYSSQPSHFLLWYDLVFPLYSQKRQKATEYTVTLMKTRAFVAKYQEFLSLWEYSNFYTVLLFVFLGILHQILRITRMPYIGDQITAVLYHVAVGPDNGGTFGDSFHPRRIARAVKTGWCGCRTVIRMIREQQEKRRLRVALLCFFDAFCRQCIKAAISAYDKIDRKSVV